MNAGNVPGMERLRAAIFRQPLVNTSTARRRPQPEDRPEWGFAIWVRRHPGLAVWVLLFVAVGLLVWPHTGVSLGQIFSNQMEGRARQTVVDVLDVVGPRVAIDVVEVQDRGPGIAATYHWPTRTITISPLIEDYDDDEFLWLVCHEVVHAMFMQMEWGETEGSANWRSFLLPGETAAEVLGAHLAGQVRSRQGAKGRHLTERFIRRHRNLCDPLSPWSYYQQVERARNESGLLAVDEEWEYLVFTHMSSPEMVDEMDQICRKSPDPWHAVRVIGERYLFTDLQPMTTAKEAGGGR